MRIALSPLAIAVCLRQQSHALGFAALFAAAEPGAGAKWIQLLPAGEFSGIDGRPASVVAGLKTWKIDSDSAAKVIAEFDARTNDLAIDYEHQTLRTEQNGQPAPAAGWIKALEWRDGKGLFAQVEWTANAQKMIDAREYRYISPVFRFDRKTGEVKGLGPAALVNYPGIDGMQEVSLSALAQSFNDPQVEDTMHPLLAALIAALGFSDTTKPEEATSAVAALKAKAGEADALKTKVAELEPKAAKVAELEQSIVALKAGAPDPAKYVPIEQVKDLQTQVAALTAAGAERAVDELVREAVKSGKVLPAMEKWARDLGKKDIAQLKSFIDSAAPIAALSEMQTTGRRPAPSADKDPSAIARKAGELMAAEAKAGRTMTSAEAVAKVSETA